MTTPDDLTGLAERCEAASGPDRELDCLIWCEQNDIEPEWQGHCLVAGVEGVIGWIDPGVHQRNFQTSRSATGPASIPAYTASLDAAMTLVPEGWRRSMCDDPDDTGGVIAELWTRANHSYANAQTAALALCAASLRARAKETPDAE